MTEETNALECAEAISDVAVPIALFFGGLVTIGALVSDGHLWALALVPVLWVVVALDPTIGKWRHVWR